MHKGAMVRWLKRLGIGVLVVVVAAGTTMAIHVFQGPLFRAGYEVTYADFLVIVLTALAVMMTVLGIFLAALAVIGWATFETKLRDTSLAYFTSQLGKDGPLRRELEALIVAISLSGVEGKQAPQEDAPPAQAPDVPYDD